MNTPRSKPPKRYVFQYKETPLGTYMGGIMDTKFAAQMGMLITIWPHVEERMVSLFAELMQTDNDGTARLIFRSIINQQTRIQVMKGLLEKSPQHKDKSIQLDELIEEFSALNTIRNKYVHSLWHTHEQGQRIYIEEDTDTYNFFLDKREIKIDELNAVIARMNKLVAAIIYRQRDRMIALAATLPQTPSQPPNGNSSPTPIPETK